MVDPVSAVTAANGIVNLGQDLGLLPGEGGFAGLIPGYGGGGSNSGGGGNSSNSSSSSSSSGGSRRAPTRGARLEYNVPAFHGRLLMKEPYGYWFDLTPVFPEYGTFKASDKKPKSPNMTKALNDGKKYTKRAGFRFASYTILLKPETKIKVPVQTAAKQRVGAAGSKQTKEVQVGSITIGVSKNVAVNEFIEFLKSCKQRKNIIGCITPKLRKHQWGGIFHEADGVGGNDGITLGGGPAGIGIGNDGITLQGPGGIQIDIPYPNI